MSCGHYLLILAAAGLATYLPRWLPLAWLPGRNLPGWLSEWLELVPAAVLAALLSPVLLADQAAGRLDLSRPELLAALPSFAVALATRSLGGTVAAGMLSYWLAGRFLH